MSFLSPYFLFALAVLAIPVLVHLFHFRRYKTILFSNVSFLRNIETERKNRNRLKHLLVLTARCLAFASLVLAFALPGCGDKQQVSGRKSVRIYLDNSYSMETRNEDGILFETAKQKAREIVNSLENEAGFQIISNDLSSVHPRYVTASEAIGQIDKLSISPRSESMFRIWRWLQSHKPEGDNNQVIYYFVSDFQNAFLHQSEQMKVPEGTRIFGMKLPFQSGGNLALDTAWLVNPFALAGEKNKLMFRISNYGNDNAEGVNVKLKAGNITAGLTKLSIEKNNSATGTLEFTTPSSDKPEAVLEIEDASVPFDNVLYMALHSRGNVEIAQDGVNTYLSAALRTNTFFETKAKNETNLHFPTDQVFYKIVNSAPTEFQINAIRNFVHDGGKAVLIPGQNMPVKALSEMAKIFGFPSFTGINKTKIKLRKEGLSNPFFNQVFQSVPTSMEMPVISNYFTTAGSNGNGDNILSLENGDPFMLHFKSGKGELYLFTAPFLPANGNFVQSVLFFPVIANCAINNQQTGTLFGRVASGSGYLLHNNFKNEEGGLVLRHDKMEAVPEIQNGPAGKELFIGPLQSKAGFYELQSRSEPGLKESIALNDARTESDPAAADAARLESLEKITGMKWIDPEKAGVANLHKTADSGLWRLFIWLAAAFFALEVILLVFWDRVMLRNTSNSQASTT